MEVWAYAVLAISLAANGLLGVILWRQRRELRRFRNGGAVVAAVLMTQAPAYADGPPDAVLAALADCQRLPSGQAQRTRWLSTYAIPVEKRPEFLKVLAFLCNSLSRSADLVPPRVVTPTLVAVDLGDYDWDTSVWEKLADTDPWFHVRLLTDGYETEEYGYWYNAAGQKVTQGTAGAVWKTLRTERVKKKDAGKTPAHAPWLPTREIAELALRTGSGCPIVRADWFVYQTGQSLDRSPGYYDFLGLGKAEKDFQALVGADVKAAQRVKREVAATIARSGVTLNNRSMERFQAITGPYYRTQDFKTSQDKQNTLRLLDGDTEPPKGDASEQYGTLPNGLFAFWLQNGKGERQDAAPDFIASDSVETGVDRRVRSGVSCIRCHSEGIRPIDDWMRRVYRGAIGLGSPDYEKAKRLRQLYLSDLAGQIKRDQRDYAETLLKCNGLTPAANAKAFANAWDAYGARDLSPADLARELGVDEKKLMAALKAYAQRTQALDPVLIGFLADPPVAIRREHCDELVPIAYDVLRVMPYSKD